MKAKEIRVLSADDIRTRLDELERERFNLKFRSASDSVTNPLRLRTIRRDIARLQTVLAEQARTTEAAR